MAGRSGSDPLAGHFRPTESSTEATVLFGVSREYAGIGWNLVLTQMTT